MDRNTKSKWIYAIFFFVLAIFIINFILEKIEDFDNFENSIYELNDDVKNLEDRVDDLEGEIGEYQGEISEYQSIIKTLKDSKEKYAINTEVPYYFIEDSDYIYNIIDTREVRLSNGRKMRKASVKVSGVNDVIKFLFYMNNQYDIYYITNEMYGN